MIVAHTHQQRQEELAVQEFTFKELGNGIVKMESVGGNRIWGLSADAKLFHLWELHDSAAPPEDKPFANRRKPVVSPSPPTSQPASPPTRMASPQPSPTPTPPTTPTSTPTSPRKTSSRSLLTRSGQLMLSRTRSPSSTSTHSQVTASPQTSPPPSPHEPGPGSVIAGWTRAAANQGSKEKDV